MIGYFDAEAVYKGHQAWLPPLRGLTMGYPDIAPKLVNSAFFFLGGKLCKAAKAYTKRRPQHDLLDGTVLKLCMDQEEQSSR